MNLKKNILITGSTGFVGSNWRAYMLNENAYNNSSMSRSDLNGSAELNLSSTYALLHFAGKAHDLLNSSDSTSYYEINTELTKKIYDSFLKSEAKVFITISSVKAVADEVINQLDENVFPNPITHYGKSKLLAEKYILSQTIPNDKRVYILRPCMIHGPGNKGNLNLLFNLVSKGFPWPLGAFSNSRSYCSIENLCFIIKELIEQDNIPSGIYNVSDDDPMSTNDVIKLIAESKGKNARILNIRKSFIIKLARLGDILKLPLNTERLQKLSESYVVSNQKIKSIMGKSLPVSSREGLLKTFQSFFSNA